MNEKVTSPDSRQPILVPVDLTDGALSVLGLAVEMAQCRGRPLVVLHVLNGTAPSTAPVGGNGDAAPVARASLPRAEQARASLEALLERAARECRGLEKLDDLRTILVDGIPAGRILEVAEREGAEMIVMGSHGRKGLSRVAMGSVAESVARGSPVPVTIVKQPPAGREPEPAP